jgi:hypothetical protein
MTAEHAEQPGGLWLSVSGLAKHLGQTKSTVSERLAALGDRVPTKPGKGKAKLVHVASYVDATNQTGDPAREAAAETRTATDNLPFAPPPLASESGNGDPTYRDAAAREKMLAADLKELELRRQLGDVVEITGLADLAGSIAELIVAAIDRLPIAAEEMAAAVGRDGVPGARAQYKRDARALRATIAEHMRKLLTISPAAAQVMPTGAVALWGDLDPAERDQ